MGSEGPVVKSEPNWASYRSSFDGTQPDQPAVHNGMTTQMYQQVPGMPGFPGPPQLSALPGPVKSPTKRKGRPKKVKEEPGLVAGVCVKQEQITETVKVKKKRDRFKGTTEEEVLTRVLPDHIKHGLDILIIGINPGLTAAYVGHHYAGPGNHFWKCLFLSGLIPQQMNAYDDVKLQDYGIGFTNIVARTSRGSADLTKKEIKEGGEILAEKVKKYKPKIAVFNGKGIYEVFCGHKKFHIGKQPEQFPDCEETAVFVMPSSSARFTQLPRAIDKVPFYLALKKYRDHLRGQLPDLKDKDIYFPDLNLKVVPKAERLAEIARQEQESGQLDIEAKVQLQAGETKPKRGRKKAVKAETQQAFQVENTPTQVKAEPGAMGPPEQSCVEDLLANGGTLVKQEDGSELANYGLSPQQLNAHHFQVNSTGQGNTTSSHTAPYGSHPATAAQYWPNNPYITQGVQGFVRPGLTYSQALLHNSQPLTTPYHHPSHGMMYPPHGMPNTGLPHHQQSPANCTTSQPTSSPVSAQSLKASSPSQHNGNPGFVSQSNSQNQSLNPGFVSQSNSPSQLANPGFIPQSSSPSQSINPGFISQSSSPNQSINPGFSQQSNSPGQSIIPGFSQQSSSQGQSINPGFITKSVSSSQAMNLAFSPQSSTFNQFNIPSSVHGMGVLNLSRPQSDPAEGIQVSQSSPNSSMPPDGPPHFSVKQEAGSPDPHVPPSSHPYWSHIPQPRS